MSLQAKLQGLCSQNHISNESIDLEPVFVIMTIINTDESDLCRLTQNCFVNSRLSNVEEREDGGCSVLVSQKKKILNSKMILKW